MIFATTIQEYVLFGIWSCRCGPRRIGSRLHVEEIAEKPSNETPREDTAKTTTFCAGSLKGQAKLQET
jgi:hypothetical protein